MPAPRPVRIEHGDASGLGLLGYAAGQAAYQDRQHHYDLAFLNAEMQRRQQANQIAQQRMFQQQQLDASMLQRSYAQRPGGGGIDPSALQQQQVARHIGSMLNQGMITPDVAARMQLGIMSGSPSLAQLGMGGGSGGMTEYQQNKMLVDAATSEEQAARQALQGFVTNTMGGLARIQQDPNLKTQYQQLQDDYAAKRDQAIQLRRTLASGGVAAAGTMQQQQQPMAGMSGAAAPAAQPLGRVNGLPFVTSQADLDRVPPGVEFVVPDGTVRRKPGGTATPAQPGVSTSGTPDWLQGRPTAGLPSQSARDALIRQLGGQPAIPQLFAQQGRTIRTF